MIDKAMNGASVRAWRPSAAPRTAPSGVAVTFPAAEVSSGHERVRGQYADCLYIHKSKAMAGVFRNIPSGEELWLMPTHLPDALEAQKALRKHPDNAISAWEDLVRRYPQGTKEVITEGETK